MKRFTIPAIVLVGLTACDLPVPNSASSADKPDTTNASPAKPVARKPVTPKPEPEPVAAPEIVDIPDPLPEVTIEEPQVTVPDFTPEPTFEPTPVVAERASIETTGTDSCGAADYAFLVGEPFAITFDVALPANAQVVGRSQKLEGTNPNRMIVRVSTRSGASAVNSPSSKIIAVSCG